MESTSELLGSEKFEGDTQNQPAHPKSKAREEKLISRRIAKRTWKNSSRQVKLITRIV